MRFHFIMCLLSAFLVGCTAGMQAQQYAAQQALRVTCADSDAGKDFYTKGTVTMNINSVPKGQPLVDICVADTLLEYYCPVEQTASLEKFKCPNGCEEGACTKLADVS